MAPPQGVGWSFSQDGLKADVIAAVRAAANIPSEDKTYLIAKIEKNPGKAISLTAHVHEVKEKWILHADISPLF